MNTEASNLPAGTTVEQIYSPAYSSLNCGIVKIPPLTVWPGGRAPCLLAQRIDAPGIAAIIKNFLGESNCLLTLKLYCTIQSFRNTEGESF